MGLKQRIEAERARRAWLDHLVNAAALYKKSNGDHMAAAVTYFSFLALFPLILVGFAVLGIVLYHNGDLLLDVQNDVKKSAPAGLGGILGTAMTKATQNWKSIGIIGLLGALYTGLGWIGNLRTAIQAIWAYETEKENFLAAKGRDLIALIGLGLAVVASLALTTAGTAATQTLVKLVHLDDVPGVGVATRILGIVIAILADTVIFGWVFVRLPRSELTMRAVFRGTLFAAIGFEILKVVGAYYIARVGQSPAAGVFGTVVGLIVFINLVSRFLLFSTAWTATAPSIRELHEQELARRKQLTAVPAPAQTQAPAVAGRQNRPPARPSGGMIAAGLVGLGMVSGATLSQAARRRLARRRAS